MTYITRVKNTVNPKLIKKGRGRTRKEGAEREERN